jgi:type IX secretion system PorP/SprF family membrane protein
MKTIFKFNFYGNKLRCLAFMLLFISPLSAQQDPQLTLSYTNQMFFNPAAIGSRNCISAAMHGRFQSIGLNGAPFTWIFTMDVPFVFGKTKQNIIGFGITCYGDYIGYRNDGGLKFAFNYRRCKVGPGDLALGIDLGLATKKISNANWIAPSSIPEPGLPDSNASGDAFDLGLGVNYSSDNFYAGISFLHLNGAEIPQLSFRFARHMYFNGGGFIPVGVKKNWRFNPHGIIRTDFATANFDVGINSLCFVKENQGIIFGITYRYIDAVAFNVGYAIGFKKTTKGILMLGYNYDLNTSRLDKFNSGSHEFVLRYCFPGKDVKLQKVFF